MFSHDRLLPEVDRVVRFHQSVQQQMASADNVIEKVKEQIITAANQLIAAEVLNLLKNVPVDELGRERTGIRFKALKDAGYQTVADVFCATRYNLASVYGISEDTAYAIKRYAQQYAEQAKPGAKIRLSVDNKTPEATKLVAAIYECRQRSATIDALEEIRREHEKAVAYGIECMQNIGTGAAWVFTETQEKQRLIEIYRYLADLMNGDYARNVNKLVNILTYPLTIDPTQAWADFERNSIAYFNILETLVPGVLGNDDTWFGLPEDLAREIQEECFFPDGLKCELRRYQEWGVKYILHQERVLLGDEMGLGKTVQAIASMVSLRNTGATHFMVVCPASVVPNWCKEVVEKSKLRVTKIHGVGRLAAFRDWQKNGGVAVTNFETTGHLKMDASFTFDMMIVDEAHYIKNTEARRTQNVTQIGEHTKRILFMTGTALENKVDEMIALVQVLQPVVASQLHHIAFMSSAPQFREKVAPVYYRRKREDVLTELPELIESKEWCAMSPEETALYESTVLHDHYMTVRRVSWNMDDLRKSCKATRMKEIIDDVTDDGRKIIVFSFFRETISKIYDFLGPKCLPPITGSLSPQRRQEIIDEFDQAPAGTVLLAQIQAGGTGLNIQSASVVIMCEPQLKPSIENQAISRAYRMGQARNVLVYRLLCEDSIDERITEMLADKQAIFDAFADKSVSAAATAKEEVAIDDKTMGKIIKDEIDRINAKKANNI
ncbi:MAG: DEAD/DEAH box helicase [Clostridia bacterium]|nr:DEAD/DEAH box helicase [Clostridia bacterium]